MFNCFQMLALLEGRPFDVQNNALSIDNISSSAGPSDYSNSGR